MVLQRRLRYGFTGYHVPPIPQAARSLRRRGPLIKKAVHNQRCPFDLLATVAGKILLEGQSSGTANGMRQDGSSLMIVKEEQQLDGGELLSIEPGNQNSSEIGQVVDKHESLLHNQPLRENTNPQSGFSSGSTSAITTSGCTDKIGFDGKEELNDGNSKPGSLFRKLEGYSSGNIASCVPKLEDQGKEQFQSLPVNTGEASLGIGSCSEDPTALAWNPSALAKPDSNIKVLVQGNHYTYGFPSSCRNNVNLVSKDDDENCSLCTRKSKVIKISRPPAYSGDERIRKLLASRCSEAPTKVKDGNLSDTGAELHSVYQNSKNGFKRQRSQRIYPFKKRKIFYSSPSTSDDTTDCEHKDICKPPERATDAYAPDSSVAGHGSACISHQLSGALSVDAGQSTSFASRESYVKVRIKSFRVPELLVELPETATVGYLKKTVLNAITTLLGDGLHIGVLVQGRKIRDDDRTLLQTGIFHDNKVDALGFTLEPSPSQVNSPIFSEQPSIELSQRLSRLVPAAFVAHQRTHAWADNQAINLANFIESDHDSARFPVDITTEKHTANSKALVAAPERKAQSLAVAPPLHKSKRPETVQRRIRRPFSVAEVEALVQAVEELGTGRWRDVKMRAFDNVKHRTYVDLKDKWKTLVHTARISPSQRRGEPVPQALLDRVLAAHAYWSQQQAKQQSEMRLLL